MGPLAALLLVTTIAAAPPTTQTVETARFHLEATDASRGAAARLATEIEPLRDNVRRLLGRDWDGTTTVRVAQGRDEFDALTPDGSRPPSWAEALAWPELNLVLVDARTLLKPEGADVVQHELLHVALGRLGKDWPRWFHEGLAQYLVGERRFSFESYSVLAGAVSADRIFRFSDLTESFPSSASDVQIAYAQSSAFIGFLRERAPPDAFGKLIDFVGQGDHFELAFAKAFKSTVAVEERAFLAVLPGRYPWWPLVTFGSSLWALGAGLVVVGWARRRQQVAKKREAQALEDAAEDAALRISVAEEARREAELAGLPPPTEPVPLPRPVWLGDDDERTPPPAPPPRVLH